MKYNHEIFINRRRISFDAPVYFVADIAANHDNDIERAKDLIWLAAEAGANAAKFQHFAAQTIVSDYGFKALGQQVSHQSKWKKSVYETYKDASINVDWTQKLEQTCKEAKIDFFTTPYSITLVDEVDCFVPAYKIGSGDITFLEIIDYISKKNKPVLLATGASTFTDVKRAVKAILKNNKDIVLMQCNTNYTGSIENFKHINLNVLNTYKKEYPGMILGLSDHTKGSSTVLAAISLGARVIEKHFTDDNDRDGPDHAFSMNPTSWKEMVIRSKEVESALGTGIKGVEENEKETVIVQRRCLRATRDVPSGHILSPDDLIALRPAPEGSYAPYQKSELIGRSITVPKIKGDAVFEWEM
ncbi:MAG: N-acetylneuraminate synthase family protein [Desulfobacter postgatei]|uniref:N-acetylneuraminate synthase family protein n=1 Tax=Desulfobacter postgatei TaxID=2293 RepID=UPI0023F54BA2|nr:N-acetylneuraminate synthase family protein [Desulfobacter postgatei]MDD4273744.1 N-acetylneuraminate synthase family protein [Desulfobacter postgatei]